MFRRIIPRLYIKYSLTPAQYDDDKTASRYSHISAGNVFLIHSTHTYSICTFKDLQHELHLKKRKMLFCVDDDDHDDGNNVNRIGITNISFASHIGIYVLLLLITP